MNLSGILVMARPEHLPGVVAELGALPGVEVHQQDPAGRLVVVLEADSVRAEADGLRRIQRLPGVLMAEMVVHYFEDDDEALAELPPEIAALPGLNACRYRSETCEPEPPSRQQTGLAGKPRQVPDR